MIICDSNDHLLEIHTGLSDKIEVSGYKNIIYPNQRIPYQAILIPTWNGDRGWPNPSPMKMTFCGSWRNHLGGGKLWITMWRSWITSHLDSFLLGITCSLDLLNLYNWDPVRSFLTTKSSPLDTCCSVWKHLHLV